MELELLLAEKSFVTKRRFAGTVDKYGDSMRIINIVIYFLVKRLDNFVPISRSVPPFVKDWFETFNSILFHCFIW